MRLSLPRCLVVSAAVALLGVGVLSPRSGWGAEGVMSWGVHVSLTPAFFDPADATGTALPLMVYYAVHDALVRPLPGTRMGAALAQSWEVSRDGLVYEFTLRKGVRFQNGDPLTAEDVKFSFDRYRGASAALLKAKVAAVEIVDPLRVRFRLKHPWRDFMTFYGTPATGAAWRVPKTYAEEGGAEAFSRAPVGAARLRVTPVPTTAARYLGLGTISSRFIPRSMEYFWQPPLYPYAPKGARALLAEAGYPNGFDAGELTGETFSGSGIGEPVVNDLNAVGIRVRLRLLERATYLKQWGDKTLRNIILAGSGAPGNAATRLEQYAVTGGLYAYGRYPEVDGLYNAQANELNPVARRQILTKMQQIIHERVMFAPVLEYAYFVGIGPRVAVDGVNALADDPYTAPYEDLRLKRR